MDGGLFASSTWSGHGCRVGDRPGPAIGGRGGPRPAARPPRCPAASSAWCSGAGSSRWWSPLLAKVSRRRQLRRQYRAPVGLAAVVDGVIVRVVDLTTSGAGLVSSHAIEPGREIELTLELPMLDDRTRPTHVMLSVTACGRDRKERRRWRVGGTLTPRSDRDHDALVEYCHVVAARSRLMADGRLEPGDPRTSLPLPPARSRASNA